MNLFQIPLQTSKHNDTTPEAEDTITAIESVHIALLIVYVIEGLILAFSNLVMFATILWFQPLRNYKGYFIIAALSLVDGLTGVGYFSAGFHRINLVINNGALRKVTRLECLLRLVPSF